MFHLISSLFTALNKSFTKRLSDKYHKKMTNNMYTFVVVNNMLFFIK